VPDDAPIDDLIRCEVGDGVARVTINRPDAGNSLTAQMRDHLTATFEALSATVGVRSIVLTGAGERHCCTGAGLGGARCGSMRSAWPPGGAGTPPGNDGRAGLDIPPL